jgi:hypothetical protein
MPTPPFSIVHANKAFCTLSGLSHSQVIGMPIEAVLQVVQEIPHPLPAAAGDEPTAHFCTSAALKGRFILAPTLTSLASKKHRHHRRLCQIHVGPITDRSKNTRGMTHVLVKIGPRQDEEDQSMIGVGATVISTDSIGNTSGSMSHGSISDGTAPTSARAAKTFNEKGRLGSGDDWSGNGSNPPMTSATHQVTVG